ncbi:hypothetical protein J6590_093210 [Homalodisca vitripennis]|nr:hypothetical protein J6590_093210 [Homalodisca vitripennis]
MVRGVDIHRYETRARDNYRAQQHRLTLTQHLPQQETEGLIVRYMGYSGADWTIWGGRRRTMRKCLARHERLFAQNLSTWTTFTIVLHLGHITNSTHTRCYTQIEKGRDYLTCHYGNGVLVGKWRDERDVLYISTQFESTMATKKGNKTKNLHLYCPAKEEGSICKILS